MGESWKKSDNSFQMYVDRSKFTPPAEKLAGSETSKFLVAVLGFFFLISTYTLALYLILRLVGVDSLSYPRVAGITGLAVLVRYIDASVVRSFGR